MQRRGRGLSGCEIPALYGTLLPEHFLRYTKETYARGDTNAQGNPRAGEQGGGEKKARDVVEKLRSMRLNEAAKKVEDGIEGVDKRRIL